MPNYDLICANGHEHIDQWLKMGERPPCSECGALTETLWRPTGRGQVIGDECDVWVKHGICNDDGTPKRYTSKKDMREAAEKKGLVNHVEHIGSKGSDKNRHTVRWT